MRKDGLVPKVLVCVLAFGFLSLMAATPQIADAAKVIRLGHGQPPGTAVDNFAQRLAKAVNERSKGELTVQVYPSSQLGKERDMVESLQLGAIELNIQGDILMSIVAPEWGLVLTTPFVIRSKEHFRKVVDGPLMKPAYDALLERKSIRHLGWVDRGPRYLTSNRAIREPAEVKGLKIRVPDGVEAYMVAWNLLGAAVVSMDISEVYLGLRQGTVDAQENPLEMIHARTFYEVQKYVDLTAHLYTGFEIVASEKWFKTLSPDLQKAVTDAAADAVAFGNKEQVADESRMETLLKQKGMTFIPVDRPRFEEALKDLPKQSFAAKWKPGFFEAVKATQ